MAEPAGAVPRVRIHAQSGQLDVSGLDDRITALEQRQHDLEAQLDEKLAAIRREIGLTVGRVGSMEWAL